MDSYTHLLDTNIVSDLVRHPQGQAAQCLALGVSHIRRLGFWVGKTVCINCVYNDKRGAWEQEKRCADEDGASLRLMRFVPQRILRPLFMFSGICINSEVDLGINLMSHAQSAG